MPAEGKVFRLTEVAEHKTTKGDNKSIWVVIHDKVYDITKFLDEVERAIKEFLIIFDILSFSILEVKRFSQKMLEQTPLKALKMLVTQVMPERCLRNIILESCMKMTRQDPLIKEQRPGLQVRLQQRKKGNSFECFEMKDIDISSEFKQKTNCLCYKPFSLSQ